MNIATRRAFITPSTEHPHSSWVIAQLDCFEKSAGVGESRCQMITRDRDTKFGDAFDRALQDRKITPVRLPYLSPNLNAHVERFIKSVQTECLDKFLVMGKRHLDHLLHEFSLHYNRERPHSAIEFKTPSGRGSPLKIARSMPKGPICCRTRLGGVLKHYLRAA